MQNILFPTDFSENAQNAYNYALHIAKQLGASITTLHVYPPVFVKHHNLPHTMQEIAEQQKLEEFETYQKAAVKMHEQAVNEQLADVEVRHVLKEYDDIIDAILGTAKEENSDLIVMGTKGASGLKEIFIGSVAAALLSNTEIPVLTIPENANYKTIKQIVYATNFEMFEEEVVWDAIKFAKLFGADIKILHVDTALSGEAQGNIDRLKFTFRNVTNISFEVLEGQNVLTELETYLDNNKVDVLAMLTHKRSLLDRLFSVSYTKKMCYHTDIPLLAFHNEIDI